MTEELKLNPHFFLFRKLPEDPGDCTGYEDPSLLPPVHSLIPQIVDLPYDWDPPVWRTVWRTGVLGGTGRLPTTVLILVVTCTEEIRVE